MREQFDKFFNLYNGKQVEAEDPTNKNQCMDLVFKWLDQLNIPREAIRHLFAYQAFTEPNDVTKKYFDIISNTPTGVPQAGDIPVFGQAVGTAGHICVANGTGDQTFFDSLDENWDTAHFNMGVDKQTGLLIPYTRLVRHNYNGILGWLRPDVVGFSPAPTVDYKKACEQISAILKSIGL